MSDTSTTDTGLTAGQRTYADDAVARGVDGERTVVAFDGRRTSWTEVTDDNGRRVARFTVTDDTGRTLTFDEVPPMTPEEQAEANEAALAADREAAEARRDELAAIATAAGEDTERAERERQAVEEERIARLVAERVAEELNRRGIGST